MQAEAEARRSADLLKHLTENFICGCLPALLSCAQVHVTINCNYQCSWHDAAVQHHTVAIIPSAL